MDDTVIEGCCEGSPDIIAEEVARKKWAKIDHNPADAGNRLKRNIEMVEKCDRVVAFFDGYSYGTSFTLVRALIQNKPVKIYSINPSGF